MRQRIARIRPSKQLRELVRCGGGIAKVSRAWRIPDRSLRRFLQYGKGINGDTVAGLLRATRLSFATLFRVEEL